MLQTMTDTAANGTAAEEEVAAPPPLRVATVARATNFADDAMAAALALQRDGRMDKESRTIYDTTAAETERELHDNCMHR